jgi:hypothetical protein
MRFVSLTDSDRAGKKLKIVFENPSKTIHFGAKGSSTYLDSKDKTKRANYIARHRVREDWTKVNAGSLSRFLLWGDSTDLQTNLNSYLKRFNISK